ncbi:hypothetical protein Q5424_07895 [Conexibacter sp. JD483]|uniref:hypothetical protein n=1 Tax=unclassified Conexibacter TaxID=2627773 RepID=UPI0027242BAD|nr:MULTISPECIES: hypothetical protein [unclassified Conexibacter]MDO8184737.1 hypothetical protein [Conexibacter sp. CPCC 205706]MDO8196512.1 hypothetical protein [Conexibacter sp. CPCC 205762]MDR9368998.1 hypothetical protein [Conexibacter sp. JD483]
MRPTRLTALLAVVVAALLAAALPSAAGAVSTTDAAQWSLGTSRPSVNVSYSFKNLINNSYVDYGKRTWGVDLVWGSSSAQWTFLPDTGSPNIRDHRRRAMNPGEKVAIYNSSTRRYLVYGSQTFGINLTWSSRPSYQWKIGSDPATGNAALFNTVENDYVAYGQRPLGINLRWLKDVRRDAQQNAPGSLHDASVTMSAQPVVQGFVPFLGYFGGGPGFNAVLTKVSNPANGTPLAFVKPGHSTSECGSDNAVTTLAPGKTMTADQMTALYGSTRPSLTQRIPFLACAGTNGSAVFVNVQWQQL